MAIAEICCGSYQDALFAMEANADRIELNAAMELGGLTPSIATLQLVKQQISIPVIAMVRPRGAGFVYTDLEITVMMEEARQLLEHQADGIAFGFLHHDCSVDQTTTKKMVELIHYYGKEAVFHRAFDRVNDPYKAMEALIACGVDRVLTSGLADVAFEGMDCLASLQQQYGRQIAILAGGGVTHRNVATLLHSTGLNEAHSSCKTYVSDASTMSNVACSILPNPNESCYVAVDLEHAKQFVETTKAQ